MSRKLSLCFSNSVMLTQENKIFELSAAYIEFIISTQTMTPAEFSDEEMTTFKTERFLINSYPVLQTNDMVRKITKFCLSWPNLTLEISGRLQNICILITIMAYNNVVVKFDFTAQPAFLPDVMSLFVQGDVECSPLSLI